MRSRFGDHMQMPMRLGMTRRMAPVTLDLAGSPTWQGNGTSELGEIQIDSARGPRQIFCVGLRRRFDHETSSRRGLGKKGTRAAGICRSVRLETKNWQQLFQNN